MSPLTSSVNLDAQASENETSIYVNPEEINTFVGAHFSVSIAVANVTDLYAWSMELYYENNVLSSTQIVEGQFLNNTGRTFFHILELKNDYNSTHGKIHAICTLLENRSGVDGAGILSAIKFKAINEGTASINLTNILIVNSNNTSISHTKINGTVHVGVAQVRDIAVTNITPSKTLAQKGSNIEINVTVENQGNIAETFNATAYYNATKIDTKAISNLEAGIATTITFIWNTADAPDGSHIIRAYVTPVPNETDTTDNEFSDGIVKIVKPPIAFFDFLPVMPIENQTVVFNATKSTPNGGTLTNYIWNFGDGNETSSTVPIIEHIYLSDGTYNVTLTVIDRESFNNTVWRLITIITGELRDVAVTDVATSTNATYTGRAVNITVTVKNQGKTTETFTVTAYYDNIVIAAKSVTLTEDESKTLVFNLNTSGLMPCHNYTIKAAASTVPGEIDIEDNTYINGNVKIKMLGDIDGNGIIDIFDIVIWAQAFGSHPNYPLWNPEADLESDNIIDVFDGIKMAINFGKKCP